MDVAFSVGNVWITFQRSGIPLALDGCVRRVEVRREMHPGLDDVHLVTIAAATHHLDAAVARLLQQGDGVHKAAWSRTRTTPRGNHTIGTSDDVWHTALAMLLVLLIAFGLAWRRR